MYVWKLFLISCIFLQAIRHEAFTHMEGEKEFVQIDSNDLYPYLLVNVGSGVSIIKVSSFYVLLLLSQTVVCCGTFENISWPFRFEAMRLQSIG